MVEFALVSFVLYLLIAAVIGLGRWMALVQSAQDAARVAAREIALHPLPAEFTFAQAQADPGFRRAVYDPDLLVVDLEATPPGPALEGFFAAMPVVNRALRPLMITSTANVNGEARRLLHLPGALIDSATSPTGLTVIVPRVDGRDAATGVESVTLVPVLEEVGAGSFSVLSPDRGLVAIRLNVPYQSATLSAYIPSQAAGDPSQEPVSADDANVTVLGGGAAGHPIIGPGPDQTGPYSGTFGMGEHLALGRSVRPFRRLVAAQAIFRREVFQ